MDRQAFPDTDAPRPEPSFHAQGVPETATEGSSARKLRGVPLPYADPENALESLAGRCRRLADAIEATSRRRDVREKRAKIVLSILALRCPSRGLPRVEWYVPGAVARVGALGLWRLWKHHWGEDPPSLKTVRAHLGELEMACVIARSPGDWLPMMRNPDHPERRPRYPDTFHVLESHAAANWWATTGRARILSSPDCRFSPDRWRTLFGYWRQEAAQDSIQGKLGDVSKLSESCPELSVATPGPQKRPRGIPRAARKASPETLDIVRTLSAAVLDPDSNAFQIHAALRSAGAELAGKMSWVVGANPEKLRGAAAMLAVALERGDAIRKPAGWLVRAFRHGSFGEFEAALDHLEDLEDLETIA